MHSWEIYCTCNSDRVYSAKLSSAKYIMRVCSDKFVSYEFSAVYVVIMSAKCKTQNS